MDGDMNDIFQKLSSMLSDKDTSDNLKNILNNFSSSNNSNENTENSKSSNSDFDINTIMKLKSAMDAMNNGKNDSRSNLLLSLKPYLRDSKKDKIDQYVKLLNMAKVIEVINPLGGDDKKNE